MITISAVTIAHLDLRNSVIKAIESAFPNISEQQMVSVASGVNDRWEVELWSSSQPQEQPHRRKLLGYGEHSPKSVVKAIQYLLETAD